MAAHRSQLCYVTVCCWRVPGWSNPAILFPANSQFPPTLPFFLWLLWLGSSFLNTEHLVMYLKSEKVKLEVQTVRARGCLWQLCYRAWRHRITFNQYLSKEENPQPSWILQSEAVLTDISSRAQESWRHMLPTCCILSQYQNWQYRTNSDSDWTCNTKSWPKWKVLNSCRVTCLYSRVVVNSLDLYSPLS